MLMELILLKTLFNLSQIIFQNKNLLMYKYSLKHPRHQQLFDFQKFAFQRRQSIFSLKSNELTVALVVFLVLKAKIETL